MATISPSSSPGRSPLPNWKQEKSKLCYGNVEYTVKVLKINKQASGRLTHNQALLEEIISDLNRPNKVQKPLDGDDVLIKKLKVGKLDYLFEISINPTPPSRENRPPMPDFKPQKPGVSEQ